MLKYYGFSSSNICLVNRSGVIWLLQLGQAQIPYRISNYVHQTLSMRFVTA
jgi:hypothetical protein